MDGVRSSTDRTGTSCLVVPHVNVNDDDVVIGEWTVARGARVAAGEPVCIVQTSKAAVEITADRDGFIVPVVATGDRVAVGAALAYLAETLEIAEAASAPRLQKPSPDRARGVRATEGALALAREHGIDLATTTIPGVTGTIKVADVQRYLDAGAVPSAIARFLEPAGNVSAHEAAMIGSLVHSRDSLILATLDYDIQVGHLNAAIESQQRQGRLVRFQHVVIAATSVCPG